MQERLVLWGTVGAGIKSLLAIGLNDEEKEIVIRAFPKEQVTEQIQRDLFAWKNGATYTFPQNEMVWYVDISDDSILPREISVDKPEFIQRAQEKWSKLLMSKRMFQVCKEEIVLHKTFVQSNRKFEQANWDKTIELWNKYSELLKKHELTFDFSRLLKSEVDDVFEILKTQKFLEKEGDKKKEKEIFKAMDKKLSDIKALLIYPDEWNTIHEQLKTLNEELKTLPIKNEAKRKLFKNIDEIYNSLRTYKKTQNQAHIEKRLNDLYRIVKGIERVIQKDRENLSQQEEKMSFYTKGKGLSGMGGLLKITQDKIDENTAKVADIKKTIVKLEKELAEIQKSKIVHPDKFAASVKENQKIETNQKMDETPQSESGENLEENINLSDTENQSEIKE
ncbi:MAG: hypothetical protein M9887_02475 [Chitinophagales bacterium]|nr:hypothetical protein [Chitinophagales bacterium]